jgi:hypothetical protein
MEIGWAKADSPVASVAAACASTDWDYRGDVPEFVDGPLSGCPDGPAPGLFVCFLPIPMPLPVSPPRPIDPSFVPDFPVLVKAPVSGEPDSPRFISGPEPVVPPAPLAVPPLDVPAELPLPLPLPPALPAPPACAKACVAPIAKMSAVVRADFICFPITVFLGVFPYGTHNVVNRCPFPPCYR